MSKIKLLYADHEQNNLNAFFAYFRRIDRYEVIICHSAKDVLERVVNGLIHIAVIDQFIFEEIGIDFFAPKKAFNTIPIAVTASRNMGLVETALMNGNIFRFHSKPFDLDDINNSISEAANLIK